MEKDTKTAIRRKPWTTDRDLIEALLIGGLRNRPEVSTFGDLEWAMKEALSLITFVDESRTTCTS
jgi:hypothetical protein